MIVPTKRCGYLRWIAAHASFTACESFSANAGGAQYTIGFVMESAYMSTLRSSISLMMRSMSVMLRRMVEACVAPGTV